MLNVTTDQMLNEIFHWYIQSFVTIGNNLEIHYREDIKNSISTHPDLTEYSKTLLIMSLQLMCNVAYGIESSKNGCGAMIVTGIESTDSYPVVVNLKDNKIDDSIKTLNFPTYKNFIGDIINDGKTERFNVDGLGDLFEKIGVSSPDSFGCLAPKSYLGTPIFYGDRRCGALFLYSENDHIGESFKDYKIDLFGVVIGPLLWHSFKCCGEKK